MLIFALVVYFLSLVFGSASRLARHARVCLGLFVLSGGQRLALVWMFLLVIGSVRCGFGFVYA